MGLYVDVYVYRVAHKKTPPTPDFPRIFAMGGPRKNPPFKISDGSTTGRVFSCGEYSGRDSLPFFWEFFATLFFGGGGFL